MSDIFVPGNISCLFVLLPDDDPSKAGSLGVGFTVNKGVHVSTQLADNTQIFFNNTEVNFPTVLAVVRSLTSKNVMVKISSELPLGSGFGLSGASALATAYSLNELLGLKKERLELAKIAHASEVANGTGMGDIVNEYYTGFLMKIVSSAQFIAERLPITNTSVYCKYFSKLPTKNILSDPSKFTQINNAGKEALAKVKELHEKKSVTFADIISISKEFAEKSGLLTDNNVIETIKSIESRGGHASMIMLGNAVFSDIPLEDSLELTIC